MWSHGKKKKQKHTLLLSPRLNHFYMTLYIERSFQPLLLMVQAHPSMLLYAVKALVMGTTRLVGGPVMEGPLHV